MSLFPPILLSLTVSGITDEKERDSIVFQGTYRVSEFLGNDPVHAALTQSFMLPSRKFRPVKPGPKYYDSETKRFECQHQCYIVHGIMEFINSFQQKSLP